MDQQFSQQDILNWAMIIITVGLLAIGLISMAIGKIAQLWAWLVDWRPTPITSSRATVPASRQNEREHGSDAVERSMEPPVGTAFQIAIDYLEQCDDDALLNILAQLQDGDDYRFAESRIAKFIPGRVEDRLAQVRDARGEPPKADEYRTPIAQRPTKASYSN